MDSLIADRVSRIYKGKAVVREASVTLTPGGLTALLGSSGAGKSTLLRLFAGLEPVDAGQICLGTKVLSRKGLTIPADKRRIGLVFQDFALFPHMTAAQNVMFGLAHQQRARALARAADWLERLGLADRADAYPHQLSGGEQQRVAIARALAPEPAAILMDEPFSGLDPALREGVREVALSAVREAGIPTLLVTHDASEAMTHAEFLAVMRAGEIVQQDTPEAVYTQPVDYDVAAALGPVNHIPPSSSLATLLGPVNCIREEGIHLDPDGRTRAEIVSVRRVGAMAKLLLQIDGHGTLRALTPIGNVARGDTVTISFDDVLSFCF